jgi:hypothetical protein
MRPEFIVEVSARSTSGWTYLDVIVLSLSARVRHEELEVMNSKEYESLSKLARIYVGLGRVEGMLEGYVEIVLMQLTLRFGPLTETVQTRVRGASYGDLYDLAERVVSARTLEEALVPFVVKQMADRREGATALKIPTWAAS